LVKRKKKKRSMPSMMKVQVKWQKSTFDEVEVDTSQPPSLFKMQLFSLTGVPPERQKIMLKGGMLKDDSDWSKLKVKPGQRLMMMGTAGPIPTAPAGGPEQDVDMEENNKNKGSALSGGKGESGADAAAAFKPPCGLDNLGNTCYMNATMQCLFSITELKQALKKYNSTSTLDSSANLTTAARDLFNRMEMQPGSSQMQSGSTKSDAFDEDDAEMMYEEQSVSPNQFLTCLRQKFPQFAQQGTGGLYMQQDAEECYSQILHTFREKLDTTESDEGKVIQNLFGIEMETKLVCEESKEEVKEVQTVYTFKCNISKEVNHLHDGFRLSLCEDREKHSTALNRMSLFKGVSRITTLPEYLSVQLVRFLYRRDTQQKAKILRRVGFPLQMLDVFEFCSEEQKQKLQVRRDVWQKREDAKAELMKKQKKQKTNGQQSGTGASALGDLDEESAKLIEKDFDPALAGHTGFYDLHAIVTHKGRIADSGHYVGWVKKKDQWVEFDDDKVYPITDEDVQKLDGGGDWHMAYLCIYKARLA
jgi:ubiquitin carboxyl-terminal hydrolase 14